MESKAVGINAVVLLLVAVQAQAQNLLFAWEYDPAVPVTQWQLLMVRSASQTTEQTRVPLVPLSAAQCQHNVTTGGMGAYAPGKTWCACLPCPGGAAYTFVLQAVVGDTESGPSNVLTAGLSAACQLIPYDMAVRTAFEAAAEEEDAAGGEPEAPSSPPAVPVPALAPGAHTDAGVLAELAKVHKEGDVLLEHYESALTAVAEDYQAALATTAPAGYVEAHTNASARQETLYRETLGAWRVLLREWERVSTRQEEGMPQGRAAPGTTRHCAGASTVTTAHERR